MTVQLGQLLISINTVSLLSSFYDDSEIDSVYMTMVYDEQYYSAKNKMNEAMKVKKNSILMYSYEINSLQSSNVYNVKRTFFIYLFIVTKTGFQKCVGVAKVDNLAYQVISNRQPRDNNNGKDKVFANTIYFFPNSHNGAGTNNVIAETEIVCTYSPSVLPLYSYLFIETCCQ